MSEATWTLADAPELHRARAICEAWQAVSHLANGLQALHSDVYTAAYQLSMADYLAACAVESATRYRRAKVAADAVSELTHCLGYFLHYLHHWSVDDAAHYHAGVMREAEESLAAAEAWGAA